jgi:plasmid stabilization system protein ParE
LKNSQVKPVELTTRALKDLRKIKSFNRDLIGDNKSEQIIDDIFALFALLESKDVDLKNMGSVDEDFLHLKYNYRKLFHNYYKITYREGKNKLFVFRIFDVRQHPNKNL